MEILRRTHQILVFVRRRVFGFLRALRHHFHWTVVRRYRRAQSIAQMASSDFWVRSRAVAIAVRFPAYAAHSAGRYRQIAGMTSATITRLPDDLSQFAARSGRIIEKITLVEFLSDGSGDSQLLGEFFELHGSDKTRQGYHPLYAKILKKRDQISRVFEVGLGTNNEDVVSNMTAKGRPGASLRAFRDFLPNAHIYGADVDRRVLFSEERIETLWVDQLDKQSVEALTETLPREFDLVVDDGLHSPDANLAILQLGLGLVRVGGWVVIEDIHRSAESIWRVIGALIPEGFQATIVDAHYSLLFIVRRDV